MTCWGPVHSLQEPGTVQVGVRLVVESVPTNQVAAILVSGLKATPLFLFLFLVIFLIENQLYRNQKRRKIT